MSEIVEKRRRIHNIKEGITQILKNEWFPYLVGGISISLSYYYSRLDLEPALTFLSEVGAKILSRFDFREYAPPIQDPRLFTMVDGSFSYTPFNHEVTILIPKENKRNS